MSKQQRERFTKAEALNYYFGGIVGLNGQGLPFTCKCGERATELFIEGEKRKKPIMSVPDIFIHIKKTHRAILREVLTNTDNNGIIQ